MEVATKFYRELYADIVSENLTEEERHKWKEVSWSGACLLPFLPEEVTKALKAVKKSKTPGTDGIENETLKCFAQTLTTPLTKIFNKIIEERCVPEQWYISEIILLFKTGDRTESNNCRPISLASNVCKVFMKILKDRLYKTLDYQQPPKQAGFRKEFSTIDHIHTLNQLIERANEYNLNLRILFIDFAKAFDSVYHHKVWEALTSQGVHYTVIEILVY